jgi:hypothetical protein
MLILKILKDERRPLHFGSIPFLHTVNVWFDINVKDKAMYLSGTSNYSLGKSFIVATSVFYSESNRTLIHNGIRNKMYVFSIRSTAV